MFRFIAASGLNLQNTEEVIDDQRGLGEIRLVCSDSGGSLRTGQRRNWLKIKQFRQGKKSRIINQLIVNVVQF